MSFYRGRNLLPVPQPTTESEVIELRIVGAFYTYFGWFPWADFEGESFSEDRIYELTGGRSSEVCAVEADAILPELEPPSKL